MAGDSPTPTQKGMMPQNPPSPYRPKTGRSSYERDTPGTVAGGGVGLHPQGSLATTAGRHPAASMQRAAGSFNPSFAPGSFSSDLRSQMTSSRAGSRLDVGYPGSIMGKVDEDDSDAAAEQVVVALKDRLNRELKIREGSENMLEALNAKKAKQTRDQRLRVEAELSASNARIKDLRQRISDAQSGKPTPFTPATPTRNRDRDRDREQARSSPSASRSRVTSDADELAESPTFALAELLQALEVEGMTPEYYVSRANQLVDLFKRHPTLKYDLVWSVFGLRMQVMLLSESREVAAAGYRMTRYAISDRASLRKIRSLNTDYLVIR